MNPPQPPPHSCIAVVTPSPDPNHKTAAVATASLSGVTVKGHRMTQGHPRTQNSRLRAEAPNAHCCSVTQPGPPKSARAPQVGGQTPGDVWKQDFEFLSRCHKDTVYLDSAATTHKPTAVVNALTRFYTQDYATVHRAVYSLSLRATDMHHAVREKVHARAGPSNGLHAVEGSSA